MTTVYKLKKKKNKKHRLLKAAVSVLVLAAVSVVAAILITNNGKLTAGGLSRLFSGAGSGDEAAEFSFSTGFRSVFAEIDGGLAVCSGSGIQVYDIGAKLMFTDAFEMSNPTVCSTGKKAAVFDLGGKSLRVFDLYGVTKSMTVAQNIISASLNENGWMALCTQETGAYKGRVTVYNGDLNEAFYWSSAKGYILSAAISPDNKSLAVLTLTEEGSRIVFLSLDSADEKGACTMPGELILEIKYLSDNRVLAVGSDTLCIVTPDGEADALFDYPDNYLNDYSVDGDGFVLLALNDYMVGDQGRIAAVDLMGKTSGVMETDKKIVSVSTKGDLLAILYSDSLVIYDRDLKEIARFDDTAGAEQVIVRPDGKALLITSHTASVHGISDDT